VKLPLVIFLFLGSLYIGLSQEARTNGGNPRPDFSGAWVPDGAEDERTTLKITYRDPKLKIIRTVKLKEPLMVLGKLIASEMSAEYVYYTDARGEVNTSAFGPVSSGSFGVKSQTRWNGERIVVSSFFAGKKDRTSVTEVTETWELSADGKTLTETTTVRAAEGTKTSSEVFGRVQKKR
jgi:hypothetical protein